LKKQNSPSPFGVRNTKAARKKKGAFASFGEPERGMRLGRISCFLVIIVMLGTAAFLTLSTAERTVGVAWGNLSDAKGAGEFILPSSGFIVVEMSNVFLDEDGYETGFDPDALLSLRGRRGEPGLLPLGNGMPLPRSGRSETPEENVSKPERTPKAPPKSASLPVDTLPMTDFSWSLSGRLERSGFTSSSAFSEQDLSGLPQGEFKFPERLVERGGQAGGAGLFTGFGVSRMTDFKPKLAQGFTLGGSSFSTANGALFADSGVSRLSSFRDSSESGGDAGNPDPGASDFETVVLSAAEDGRKLALEEGEESGEEEDVVLAEVSVLWTEHVVKAGETLSDIAVAHGVPMSDIVKANELKNANRLSEKQLLLIPNDSAAVEATLEQVLVRKARVVAAREKVIPIKITAYVVAEGDSLWSIANSQNLEIDTLYGSNDLKNPNMIRPGATLRIPNQDGIFHKIKSGDTLASIAKKYGIAAERIREANGDAALNPFIAGKEIFLPGARPEATDAAEAPITSSTTTRSGASSAKTTSSAKVSGSSRNHRWPVVGKINSPFGWRRHPVTRRRDFHTGIDIKASRGSTIRASRAGRVEYSGWMGGYGKVVVVNHGDGHSTLYAHCNSLSVGKGQQVTQGQAIATVGTTGRTTGPHLHFEIRRGNNPVNPLGLLR